MLFVFTETPSIVGYIHAVSVVKLSKDTKRKYFNCVIQTEKEVRRAVSFLPTLRGQLKTFQQTRAALKIERFSTTRDDSLLFSHDTKFSLKTDGLHFECDANLSPEGEVSSLKSLDNFVPEQIVSVRAQVVTVGGSKKIHSHKQGTLQRQEVLLRDTTASIKLVLWEDNIDALDVNTTYLLENIKVKSLRGVKYLNTAKDVEFLYHEVAAFTDPLFEVDDLLDDYSLQTYEANIVGIQQISRTLGCLGCKKRVVPQNDNILGDCEGCHLTQLVGSCELQYYLRLVVKDIATENIRRVTVFTREARELMQSLRLKTSQLTDAEVTSALLSSNATFSITVDPQTFKVESLELVM